MVFICRQAINHMIFISSRKGSENVYLQVESLGLGTVAIGAFHDEEVGKILGLSKEKPLLIMPVGRAR